MADGEGAAAGPGRPRSAAATRSILDATIDGLIEDGYEGLTMEGVASRAGVGKTTVYRRWSDKESLVRAAVADFVSWIAIPDNGSIRADLLELERQAVAVYQGRPGRLMPALVSAMARSPELSESIRNGFLQSRRAALRTVLRRGVSRGELRRDADLELALDFLGGPLFYRLLVTGGPLDEDLAVGVVDVMLDGISAG